MTCCAQDDADGTALGGVVSGLEGRVSDDGEVKTIPDEGDNVPAADRSLVPPAACPARDSCRLVSRYGECVTSQLRLLDRRHVHFVVREPAAEFRGFPPNPFRIPAEHQQSALELAVVAVSPILGSATGASPGHPWAADSLAPAVGPHGGGRWSHLPTRAGPRRSHTARPGPRRYRRRTMEAGEEATARGCQTPRSPRQLQDGGSAERRHRGVPHVGSRWAPFREPRVVLAPHAPEADRSAVQSPAGDWTSTVHRE